LFSMPLQLLFALFIVGALNEELEGNLDDQLTECTNILGHAQSFYGGLPNFNDNRRRLADSDDDGEKLEDDVEESLDTCLAVVQAVNNFYNDYEDGDGEIDLGGPWKDPIILNVGGTHFPTTLATLRSRNGTLFEKMFRNGSMTKYSPDGTFFIDRNPGTLEFILEFLRTGDLLLKSGDNNLRPQLLDDAEFFELPEELIVYLRFSCLEGIDLSFSEVSWLNNALPGNTRLGGLLFDTSKDGDAASTFHNRCDGEGATVTIVETTLGVMFGGYTDLSWSSSGGWGTDSDAFVFRLRPSSPKKFVVRSSTTAIYRSSGRGPYFGNNAFVIQNYPKSNAKSFVSHGTYHGLNGYFLNNDHYDFRVEEYVVVQAV